ncbi:bifunctional lysylphosphatidylglycerol flippase/synthetase MprF [Thiobaca trueperi]|uniref:Phosphatidylglycerol lysyltransferase n=1 Tax=Thiobaca trueperi TaxID=127458 RepID=A0A4R3N6M1_9GAMM|nr:bifunctional lysylphosphatidylglycerol flippase/synthetase MprF [Thiobaca trueperi]TCT23776.1 phosphatidylglycerol lysyltransferase [Thiobaca trueperi]
MNHLKHHTRHANPAKPSPGADSNRRAISLLGWLRRAAPPLLALAALLILWFELQGFDVRALHESVRRLPVATLLGLQALALTAVFSMVLYDWWVGRWLKIGLPLARLIRYSWVANTMNNLIGLSGLAGSGIRILLLVRDGVTPRVASLHSGVIMLSVPVGLSVLVPFILAQGHANLLPAVIPQWAVLTVLIACAVYLPVFLALASSRAVLHRVLSGETRIGLAGGVTLVGISALDWLLAVIVAWCCLAAFGARVDPGLFLSAFTLAATLGIVSLIPGGIGVFDASLLAMLTRSGMTAETALAGLLIFRLVYYLVPWLIGLYLGSGLLTRAESPMLGRLARQWQDNPLLGLLRLPLHFLATLGVRLLSLLIFATGLVLLVSAALPALEERIERLLLVLPLPAIEISHFLSVGVGVLLIALSRGIGLQARSAYQVAMPLLLAAALLSLLKGAAAGLVLFPLTVAGLLWLRRDAFYRLSYPLFGKRGLLWLFALVASVAAYILLGSWLHTEELAESGLWLQSEPHLHVARYLRSLPLALLVLAGWLAWGLFRMPRPSFPPTDAGALIQARDWLETHGGGTFAHLLFMGDKHLLYTEDGRCLIQYKRIRSRLVALGDPMGAEQGFGRALLEFRDLADRHDLDPVCYEIANEHLHLYHDCGFALFKAGEMGQVPLAEFSLTGRRNQSLRTAVNRAVREGLTLELLQPPLDAAIWGTLEAVSDAWLRERGVGEKRFSLGAFDRDYLSWAPLFVARQGPRIVAFASLTPSYLGRRELGLDLMRHLPDAPYGTMDFLFTRIIEWARDEGYTWFNLGMAPLSGVGNIRYARPDERLAGLAYDYGSRLYNYKGLRSFKEKFHPVWQSRYIAYPLYRPLPMLLVDLAALVAGGYRRILSKP